MRCPACDAAAPEGALFCSRCGARLPGPATGPERRVVTALFCDLVDSTVLGERTDPEELDRMHRRYFALARETIERHGGTVEKFIGDAVAALFGFPVAHEDDTERAVRAAVEIVDGMRAAGLELAVRVAVETGEAFVRGDVAAGHGFATGDVTNTASRLQSAAEPMSVVVGPRARASAVRSFELAELPPLRLKGKEAPVSAWRVVAPLAASGQAAAVASLVGRARELDELRGAVAGLAGGAGGVLLVEGEPGIGKSRLVHEVRHGSAALWLRGRSVETPDAAGYRPFAEQIREWVGPEPGWDELVWRTLALGLGRRSARFLAALSGIEPDPEAAAQLALVDPEGLRPSLYRSAWAWVDALAASRPLVLEFEDWHWADAASVQLLEHLLPLTASRRLLVLAIARPGAATERALSGAAAPLRRLSLAPLPEDDARRLLEQLVSGRAVPAERLHGALARAEGNPYFLHELSRFVTEDEGAAELPDSVRAVVTSRVDRLEPELRSLLRSAAVVGRTFATGLLEQLDAGRPVDADLERLAATRLVEPLPPGRYRFAHALAREAVYEGIPLADRRRLHRTVADALAEEPGGAASSLPAIAYHLAQSEDWEAAAAALVAAGQQAARIASDDEALEMYRAAIEAHERLPAELWGPLERSRIDREVADALRRLGRNEEASRQITAALARLGVRLPEGKRALKRAALRQLLPRVLGPPSLPPADAVPDPVELEIDRELEVLGWIAYFDDFDRVAHSDLLLANRAARARDLEGLGVGTFRGALAFAALGRRRLARRYARRALEASELLTDPIQVARLEQGIGIVALQLGGWEETAGLLQPTLDVCAEAGELRLWGGSAALLAFAAGQHGDLDRVGSLGAEMERAGLEGGNRQIRGWGLMTSAAGHVLEGDAEPAALAAHEGVEVLARVPDHLIGVVALGVLAKAQVRLGRTGEAAETIGHGQREVEERAFRGIFVSQLVQAEAERALLELAGSRNRETEAAARRATRSSVRQAHIGRWHAVHAHVLEGGRHWLLGDERRASRAFARAAALAREYAWHGALDEAARWVARCCDEAGVAPPAAVGAHAADDAVSVSAPTGS